MNTRLSVVSGRDLSAIAADADRVWSSKRTGKAKPKAPVPKKPSAAKPTGGRLPLNLAKLPHVRKAPQPTTLQPQLATLASQSEERRRRSKSLIVML